MRKNQNPRTTPRRSAEKAPRPSLLSQAAPRPAPPKTGIIATKARCNAPHFSLFLINSGAFSEGGGVIKTP